MKILHKNKQNHNMIIFSVKNQIDCNEIDWKEKKKNWEGRKMTNMEIENTKHKTPTHIENFYITKQKKYRQSLT